MTSVPLERFFEHLTRNETIPLPEAYERVGFFRNACDRRANAISTLPFDVLLADEVIYSDADVNLQTIASPALDVFNLLDDMVLDLDIFGAFYAMFETNQFGRNGAWRRIHPTTMRVVTDPEVGHVGFQRTVGGQSAIIQPDDSALLWLWAPNRNHEVGPGAPLAVAASNSATALYNIGRFQSAFFENGALNPTILSIEGYEHFPDREQSRIRDVFQRIMSGVRNAFNIIPVGGTVSATNLMQPLDQLGMEGMVETLREEIATALGIPHSLMMSNAANFATAKQDDVSFYDKTLIPLARMIQHQLNTRLFFEHGATLVFRPGRLEAFQALESEKAERLGFLFDRGVITLDEYRKQMGLEPLEPADDTDDTHDDTTLDDAIENLQVSDNERALTDLEAWRRKAAKRVREGRHDRAVQFDEHTIPAHVESQIVRQLERVRDTSAVNQIFDDARLWLMAPHAGY